MPRLRTSIVTMGTFIWLSSSLAHAQSNEAAAEALFEGGKKLMAAGDYARACPKLAESQRLDPGAGTLLNLAACYEKGGQTASAWVTYKEAITVAEKSNRKEWAAQANKRVKALEPSLSRMTIVVPANARVDGLVVKRDGTQVGEAEYGVAIPQDPGKHLVEAAAPGKKPFSAMIDLGAKADAQTTSISLVDDPNAGAVTAPPPARPEPVSSAATPAVDREPSGSNPLRIVGAAVAGVGVVGIGVGAVFGHRAGNLNADSKVNCNADQSRCNAEGLDQVDRAKGAARLSTIGFVAGGALVIGGVVLFLTAKSGDTKTAKRTVIVPTADASGGGLFMSGSF